KDCHAGTLPGATTVAEQYRRHGGPVCRAWIPAWSASINGNSPGGITAGHNMINGSKKIMKRRNGLRMKMTKPLLSLAAGLVLGAGMMAGSLPAEACTSFVLPTTDGKRIYARTMEFEFDMKSSLVGMPRHLALSGTGPEGKTGMQWQ